MEAETLSTVAGTDEVGNKDGTTQEATFGYIKGIAVDKNEGSIYVLDKDEESGYDDFHVRKISTDGMNDFFQQNASTDFQV